MEEIAKKLRSSRSSSVVCLVDYDNLQQKFAEGTGKLDDNLSVVLFYGAKAPMPDKTFFPGGTLFYKGVDFPQSADVALTMVLTLFVSRLEPNDSNEKRPIFIVHGGDGRYSALAETVNKEYERVVKVQLHTSVETSLFDILDHKNGTRKACRFCRILFSHSSDIYLHRVLQCEGCNATTCSALPTVTTWQEAHKKVYWKVCETLGCRFGFYWCTKDTIGASDLRTHDGNQFFCDDCKSQIPIGGNDSEAVAKARHNGDQHSSQFPLGERYACPWVSHHPNMKKSTFEKHIVSCKRQ